MKNATAITKKGQVTVPVELRRKLGIKTGQKIKFELTGGRLLLQPLKGIISLRGSLQSRKKFNKAKARRIYLPQVLSGKI